MCKIPPLDLIGEMGKEYASKTAVPKKADSSAKTSLLKHYRKFRNLTRVVKLQNESKMKINSHAEGI